jgi:recombination protein RecA
MNKIDEIENNFGKNKKIIKPLGINLPDLINLLGITDYPRGKMIEIYGNPKIGKTTLILKMIKELNIESFPILLDAERAYDSDYFMSSIGEKAYQLLVRWAVSSSDIVSQIEHMTKIHDIDIIFLDSLAMLDRRDYSKVSNIISRSDKCFIFTNQIRWKKKIRLHSYGDNEIHMDTAIRIEIKKKTYIKEHDKILGMNLSLRTVKNKLAVPFKEVELPIYFNNVKS